MGKVSFKKDCQMFQLHFASNSRLVITQSAGQRCLDQAMSSFLIVGLVILIPAAIIYAVTELDARVNKDFIDDMENPWKKR